MKDSKHGEGNKTKFDKNVRDSKEISGKEIELTPEFTKELQSHVNVMAQKLRHPKKVNLSLAKMVVYEKGGHFKYHIDSNHKPNMIFTLSVEIFVNEENEGGNLIFKDENKKHKVPSPREVDELVLAMFYHDVQHEVSELTKGTRICLIFDILEREKMVNTIELLSWENQFLCGLKSLKKANVQRIGVLMSHLYIAEDKNKIILKGNDALFKHLVGKYSKSIKIIEITLDSCENIFMSGILNVLKFSDSFGTLYYENNEEESSENGEREDDAEEESDDDDDETRKIQNPESKELRFDEMEDLINWDEEKEFFVISKEYLLGDVVFLKTPSKDRKIFTSDDDLWLGNEGFSGSIMENLALVAELDHNLIK